MDRYDVLAMVTLIGLLLLGLAVGLALGLVAALAYAGATMTAVGIAGTVMARRQQGDG